MSSNLAVIGERDLVLSFKALGIPVFGVDSLDQAKETMRKLIEEEYALIFITETLASGMSDLLQEVATKPVPAIIPIPTSKGSSGFALNRLRETIKKAVGADVFKEER